MSGAKGNLKQRWAFSLRGIPGEVPRAQIRSTLTYAITSTLRAGIELNPRSEEEWANPLVNWLALSEGEKRPAIILGTSSDRIGTPTGQSFYATGSKDLRKLTGLPIAPYLGTAWTTYQDRFLLIGGMNVRFTRNLSGLAIFDGVHLHPTINWNWGPHTFSLVLVRSQEPGLSYSVSF